MSGATEHAQGPRFFEALTERGVVEKASIWEGCNLRIGKIRHFALDGDPLPASGEHVLVFPLALTKPVRRSYGATFSGVSERVGTGTMLPAGRSTRWECESSSDVLHFYLDDAVLRKHANDTLDLDPSKIEVIDHMDRVDPFLLRLAPLAQREIERPGPAAQLMIDGFEQLIAAHVVAHYSNLGESPRPSPRALDPTTLARVMDHMHHNLDDRLALADLAAYASMSVFEFSRAFKASTGQPPYQMLLEIRVTRVQELLRSSTMSLAEIAYACGFSSQAHMTTTFARHVGVTPGRYRKELRN